MDNIKEDLSGELTVHDGSRTTKYGLSYNKKVMTTRSIERHVGGRNDHATVFVKR